MIAKAKSISHGVNSLRYISGEAASKKHPDRIFHVVNNLLDDALDSCAIYDMMAERCRNHPKMKNNVIRIELSPSLKHTESFTIKDWQRLWSDFVRAFDSYEPKTNLANSMGTVWLHLDSKSGIPHLHAVYCRVDENGNTNDDHNIHLRAQWAAEQVAKHRRWTTAKEAHERKADEVRRTCESELKQMKEWSWSEYSLRLKMNGYDMKLRRDSNGKAVGYSLKKGNTIYHASKLGTRSLTAAHIEQTWRRLRMAQLDKEARAKHEARRFAVPKPSVTIESRAEAKSVANADTHLAKPLVDYSIRRPYTTMFDVEYGGREHRLYIPNKVADLFNTTFDELEYDNAAELCSKAMAIFAELYLAQHDAPASSGDGGSHSELPWRDKNEDEMAWARRCANFVSMTTPLVPRRRYGRGR